MVDVIISCPSIDVFIRQIKAFSFEEIPHGPVRRNRANTKDVLGDVMFFRIRGAPHVDPNTPQPGSAATIASHLEKYRLVDAFVDGDGNTIPAVLSSKTYLYLQFQSERDFNALLALTVSPNFILRGTGGSQVIYATSVSLDHPTGNGDGTWGDAATAIPNGLQVVRA